MTMETTGSLSSDALDGCDVSTLCRILVEMFRTHLSFWTHVNQRILCCRLVALEINVRTAKMFLIV